jgi:ankyrin repeat protein
MAINGISRQYIFIPNFLMNRNIELAQLLIERGAEVDPRDKYGLTPLHYASRRGRVGVSRVLIDHGAVNARKFNNWTPLHSSVYHGYLELTELLLERGANVHVLSDEGLTPYQLSLQRSHRKVAYLLRDHSS